VKYPVRRAIRAVLLLFGCVGALFLSRDAPGSFFDEMRLNPQISPETISALRAATDGPTSSGEVRPLADAVAHGDLGFSIAYNARSRRCSGAGR